MKLIETIKKDDTDVTIEWTTTWARSKSYYKNGCEQSDVDNQVPNDKNMNIDMFTCNPGDDPNEENCGSSYDLHYTVTYAQLDVDEDNQYCYGGSERKVNKNELTEPAEIGWEKCCWVTLTKDNGDEIHESSTSDDSTDESPI